MQHRVSCGTTRSVESNEHSFRTLICHRFRDSIHITIK